MIATTSKSSSKEDQTKLVSTEQQTTLLTVKPTDKHKQLAPYSEVVHHPEAGINPVVDFAAYLFSMLGHIKQLKSYRFLSQLQKEIIQEINRFQENIKNMGYNPEYIVVCRYLLCATFDEMISNATWCGATLWENYSLLAVFQQDREHHKKFFTIMERIIKQPALYIDMMELMYLCLSFGYKGQYRATEFSQLQLEQTTNTLYKHIRAYRGNISKTLSPRLSLKPKIKLKSRKASPLFIFFVTASAIMIIFISLGYLMDVISNEVYKDIFQSKNGIISEANP